MRRYVIVWIVLALIAVLGIRPEQVLSETKPSDPNAGSGGQDFAPGRIIVKVEEEAPANAVESLNRRNDARIEEKLPHSRVSVIDLPRDLSVGEAVARYENSPDVQYAEPDYRLYPAATPNDPDFSKQYNLHNTGQYGGTVDADINAREAWDMTMGQTSAVVAVIDTGVDINHSDLKDNIWTNTGEIAGNGIDDDDNKYVDDVHGWDFHNNDNSVFDADENPHGTHVAGTIAAEGDNAIGVTGVSWQAKIMPLKFIGPQTGYTSDAVEALNYAVDNDVKISNNSYGPGSFSQTFQDALTRADKEGHLFVAAAGNGGGDLVGDNNDAMPFYPASYENPNVISVAASDPQDNLAAFSNYGASSVDLAAPGTYIYSTVPGDGYAYKSGTSMATPHVAGTAALVRGEFPELDDAQIKAKILGLVDKKTGLDGKVFTGGRLNAARAVGAVAADTTRPTISGMSPRHGSVTRDSTPLIKAVVRDNLTNLQKADIKLYVAGKLISPTKYAYSASTDALTYNSPRLSTGKKRVKVVAADAAENVGIESWYFTIR